MSEFQERMAQLRARFLERARGERVQLIAAVEASDEAEIQRIAHSLSGAGGLFGFPHVSAAAHRLETSVGSEADLQAPLRTLLAELDRAFQEP